MKKRIIYETPDKVWRIIETPDYDTLLIDLEGDTFKPDANPDIAPDLLARDQTAFRHKVEIEGVFGYVLERWNPTPSVGYEHVDSCFGFVGQYVDGALDYEHYIIEELKQLITASNDAKGA